MAQTLDANLNVIQETPIELELINGDLNIISKLDDEPNDVGGLTSTELKAKFDEAGNIIKTYLNESLVPAVLAADATEATRSAAEAERVANETERVDNENARVSAEETRMTNETNRQTQENTRKSNELARIAAEQERAANEEQRIINENAREDLEIGYVARAEAAAARAEAAAENAESAVGGDYATKAQAKEYANTAESNAKSYADQQIAAIPTPDVSAQIAEHNADEAAHPYIRAQIASRAPMYTYGTTDLEAGVTPLASGMLHFVYEGDGEAATIISFSIEEYDVNLPSGTYTAESGMTWGEWLNSGYCIAGFMELNGEVYYNGAITERNLSPDGTSHISVTAEIIANKIYTWAY